MPQTYQNRMTMRQFLFILTMIFLPLSMHGQETLHGVCGLYGGNVLWDLKGDTLFIHGKGEMANYDWVGRYLPPWKNYAHQIKCVVIGDSVTSVGDYAMQYCQHLTSLVLPQSLKTIGVGAFWECFALDSVAIPDSVSIERDAFRECTSLHAIKLPEYSLVFGPSAFSGCVSLDSIRIPKGIKSLEWSIFQDCTSLCYVEIPSSITSIGDGVFKGCESLYSVKIPNGVTSLGKEAFSQCTALDSITIPSSITSMGQATFEGCANLKSVKLPESLATIPSSAFSGCKSLKTIEIPDGVTTIEWSAFNDCEHLLSVIISQSVTSIGYGAFYNCMDIEDVFCYPSVMPQAAENAFDNFGYFPLRATLHVPKQLMDKYSTTKPWAVFERRVALPDADVVEQDQESNSIIYYAFRGDGETVSVTSGPERYAANVKVPAQILTGGRYYRVVAVEDGAFMKCPDLSTVFLNNTISHVGPFAFSDCFGLTSVRLPSSITAIEDYTFSNCISLSGISIPGSVTSIGEGAFADCRSLKTVSLPARTTSIGMRAFANCSALTTVELPKQLTMIDDNAFEDCRSLTTLTLPNTITLIGNSAFKGCTGLTEIVFDGCVGEIWQNAFTGCTGLKDIYSYSDIPPAADETAFDDSSYDANLHVPASSLVSYASTAPWCYFKNIIPHTESIYGGIICQYDYNSTDMTATLRKVIVSDNTYDDKLVIPAELEADGKTYEVTAIDKWALYNLRGVSSVEIPSSIHAIESYILITEQLKTIRIMGDVDVICPSAFYDELYIVGIRLLNCSLNDFYCYSSFVPKLSPLAFNGYGSRFKSDDDIAVIEQDDGELFYVPRYYTFSWSDSHNNIHQEPRYQYYLIEHATLHVPAELVESYKQTFPWNMFGNIVALTEEEMADGIMENVKIEKFKNERAVFNLQGQRIKTLQKGLNIVDGEKVWVR